MKRFRFSIIIIVLILAVCSFALVKIVKVSDELTDALDQISVAIEQNKTDQILNLVGKFETKWENSEKTLMHYIHHDELDTITGVTARLTSLARYQDYSELSAEIDRLRHLIKHVCESQMPIFKNIF